MHLFFMIIIRICRIPIFVANTNDKFIKMRFFTGSKIFTILMISGLACISPAFSQPGLLVALSYNIRLATPDDAPNTWSNRKEKVFSIIQESNPDVFGLQEVLKVQLDDFKTAFPMYAQVGVGRDDGKDAGEFSPVFYNINKYKLLTSGTLWLSQTPSVAGSRGWDAACNRIVSWVKLKEKKTKTIFFVFNTHFDHLGVLARRNSAQLLLHIVDSLGEKNPAIVLGDFNSLPDSEPYKIIADNLNLNHLTDSKLISNQVKGPDYTFTGFKVGAQAGNRIDYIFVKNIDKVEVYHTNLKNNGEYFPSDHLPVSATIRIK